MQTQMNIDWKNIKAIIFDVDGTLYNQSKLKIRMLWALLMYYLIRPARYQELIILYHFRKEREKKSGYCSDNLDTEQYVWCAEKLNVPVEKVISVINFWIYKFPLKYINRCKYKGVEQLFTALHNNNIKTGIYSDYPAKEKLNAMHLTADLIVTSIDPYINCFKPQPKAIYYICSLLAVSPGECVFIGDRYSRDGKCAENAGALSLLLPSDKKQKNNFFISLNESLNPATY